MATCTPAIKMLTCDLKCLLTTKLHTSSDILLWKNTILCIVMCIFSSCSWNCQRKCFSGFYSRNKNIEKLLKFIIKLVFYNCKQRIRSGINFKQIDLSWLSWFTNIRINTKMEQSDIWLKSPFCVLTRIIWKKGILICVFIISPIRNTEKLQPHFFRMT